MRPLLFAQVSIVAFASHTWFLRRGRGKPTRNDAFTELFDTLATLYESASYMKPEWRDVWQGRREEMLPKKYSFGNSIATSAAYDMRFATFLLQRYRWKSLVRPLFADYDDVAWNRFQRVTSSMPASLLAIGDSHMDRFFEDELDWIQSAIEQFDEARRLYTTSTRTDTPASRQIAEGTYLPIYIAIQLSDRFIERLRFEAGKVD